MWYMVDQHSRHRKTVSKKAVRCKLTGYVRIKRGGHCGWIRESAEEIHLRGQGTGKRVPDREGPAGHCKDFGFFSKRNREWVRCFGTDKWTWPFILKDHFGFCFGNRALVRKKQKQGFIWKLLEWTRKDIMVLLNQSGTSRSGQMRSDTRNFF